MRLVLRHTQPIFAAAGGANVITLVTSPSYPANPAPSSVEVGTSNRRRSYRYTVYDSKSIAKVRQFAQSDCVELLVMTIDSF
ncbi:MAG: hypothetical protein WBP52_16105, partial [Terriglobales bacterium]